LLLISIAELASTAGALVGISSSRRKKSLQFPKELFPLFSSVRFEPAAPLDEQPQQWTGVNPRYIDKRTDVNQEKVWQIGKRFSDSNTVAVRTWRLGWNQPPEECDENYDIH
jgi:hypothetical protein